MDISNTCSCLLLQKEDAKLFQLERILNVQCLQRVNSGDKTTIDPELVCFRGLEPYRSEKRRQKFLLARQTHVVAVLEEQLLQRNNARNDTDRYREVVQTSSRRALQLARLQAICDEREVYPGNIAHIVHDAPATKKDCKYAIERPHLEQESPKHIAVRAA